MQAGRLYPEHAGDPSGRGLRCARWDLQGWGACCCCAVPACCFTAIGALLLCCCGLLPGLGSHVLAAINMDLHVVLVFNAMLVSAACAHAPVHSWIAAACAVPHPAGFVWDKKGRVVTNYHVIRGASDVLVSVLAIGEGCRRDLDSRLGLGFKAGASA